MAHQGGISWKHSLYKSLAFKLGICAKMPLALTENRSPVAQLVEQPAVALQPPRETVVETSGEFREAVPARAERES